MSERRRWSAKRGEGQVVKWLRDHVTYAGDGCLTFPFSRSRFKGYGSFGYLGTQHYAHRFMCELAHGPAPTPEHQASHLCGMGHEGCVHPFHLAWKTNSENQRDRRTHGTARKRDGIKRKLTPEQIAEIRRLKGQVTQYDLAQRFGVKVGTIEYWQKHNKPPSLPVPDEVVRQIRALGPTMTQAEIAQRTGVPVSTVFRIVHGRVYKNVA